MENCVSDRLLHFALRKTLTHLRHPVTLTALACASLVLALAAPFNTRAFLNPVPLLSYWALLCVTTYSIGYFLGDLMVPTLRARAWPYLAELAAVGVINAAATTLWVMTVNLLTFGSLPGGWGIVTLSALIFAIAAIITVLIHVLSEHLSPRDGAAGESLDPSEALRATPPLLDRLPLDQRAPLVSLSVEDHYVRVRTTKGETMVLLRLGDAIRETTGVAGMQVHRSHWVALDHVKAARREADRAVLTLAHGPDIPVARSYIPVIRDAGLLPKS